jgi:undecaprenyl-diphosphatase
MAGTGTGMSVGRLRRDPRVGWLAFALWSLGAFGAFVLVAVLSMSYPAFDQIDGAMSAAVRATRSPILNDTAGWLTLIGSVWVVAPVIVALMAWMAVRRNWRAVLYVFMTVAVGWFLGNDVIKFIVRRPRPVGVNIVPLPGDFALPSGHSLASFLLFTTLCVIVMLNLPTGNHVKRWVAIVSAVLIVGIGLSRVYLGVHWLGDVIGAWLFGTAWWLFTTSTYFGSVTEERRTDRRPGVSATSSE